MIVASVPGSTPVLTSTIPNPARLFANPVSLPNWNIKWCLPGVRTFDASKLVTLFAV